MSGTRARLLGLAMLALGAAVAWLFGVQPLLDARAGAAEVALQQQLVPGAFLVAPMAAMVGLFMIVGGGRVGAVMMRPPRSRGDHLIVWPMFATSLAAGGLGWLWIEGQVAMLGYVGSPVI